MPSKKIPTKKDGTPRKNDAGRPPLEVERTATLTRITPGKKKALGLFRAALAETRGRKVTEGEALETAIVMAVDVMLGVDPRRWLGD